MDADDQAPAATREWTPPEYGTVEYDGREWPGVCLRCWGRMLDGTASFIHPSWLRILPGREHDHSEGHRTWLDLTSDEKDCHVADMLGGKIREEQPDGSWRTVTAEEVRFA